MKTKSHMTFSSWWDIELTKEIDKGLSEREAVFALLEYIAESDIMNKIEWSDENIA